MREISEKFENTIHPSFILCTLIFNMIKEFEIVTKKSVTVFKTDLIVTRSVTITPGKRVVRVGYGSGEVRFGSTSG